jgi:hypothetical protein
VPDWDSTERRDSDEDAAWRDLIARFDAPPVSEQPAPWPEREDTAPPAPAEPDSVFLTETSTTGDFPADPAGGGDPAGPAPAGPDLAGPDLAGPDLAGTDLGGTDPAVPGPAGGGSAEAGTMSSWRTSAQPAADPDDEHFVPPPPPPLPSLEPLTKAAWAALFGGPAYLLIATAAGWSMPGIAVFCAIAAFVAGVALLVLRLNDSGPPSSGDDDNGAVV